SLAYALYDSGRCAEAVEEYRSAARLAPPAYELLLDWGLALDCAGNRAEAVAVLEKAAALQKTAHVYALLGMEHAKDGRLTQALALLDQAESIDPAFEPTFLYRGNVHALLGERQKAIADFRKALALNAEDTAARQALQQLGP
ncbi:MAG TPA: tetratricopeptide repeat protein, partial [Bryobacteraceae bacterium]|nr:tetratricopeptide repeat protein [Bryobacteraceae bacterium]